jgi:hypothetical protein
MAAMNPHLSRLLTPDEIDDHAARVRAECEAIEARPAPMPPRREPLPSWHEPFAPRAPTAPAVDVLLAALRTGPQEKPALEAVLVANGYKAGSLYVLLWKIRNRGYELQVQPGGRWRPTVWRLIKEGV